MDSRSIFLPNSPPPHPVLLASIPHTAVRMILKCTSYYITHLLSIALEIYIPYHGLESPLSSEPPLLFLPFSSLILPQLCCSTHTGLPPVSNLHQIYSHLRAFVCAVSSSHPHPPDCHMLRIEVLSEMFQNIPYTVFQLLPASYPSIFPPLST